MKPALQLRPSQQLALNPRLLQSLRLLQLSALELEQEIDEALAANPFLERVEPASGEPDDARTRGDAPQPTSPDAPAEDAQADHGEEAPEEANGESVWGRSPREAGDDDIDLGSLIPSRPTLREHLLAQASAAQLSERDRGLVAVLVEALDEDGYLRQSLEELEALLPQELAVDPGELRVALAYVQSLDPCGVGARSLGECLELQLKDLPRHEPGRDLALAIVRDRLQLLASHDTLRLSRALQCDEAALRAANCLIRRLDPRPGARFAADDVQYVVADVVVRKINGRWVARVNPDAVPRMRVHRLYAEILQRGRATGAPELGARLQEARWLVRNVEQRFATIQRVAQAIVDRQRRFFEHGDLAMRPLGLRDIAAEVGLHPSTVSRVTCNKYLATPRGLVAFKRFFGGQVPLGEGAACSSTAIRALVKEIIAAEDARAPLSDVKVAKLLGAKGIRLARRTVTKYRIAMKIPPVEARRLSAA
jgi:RNA polymerase sigma-54 factor